MEWLTEWLKKIILLVLLAAFLDLILPNTNLQKYVKMVMGIIILLTILTPVFSIFSISPEDLAIRINRFQETEMPNTNKQEWKPLADKLLGQQDKQVTNYVMTNIEKHIKTKLKEEYNREVSTVKVSLTEETTGEPKIKNIVILLQDQSAPVKNEPGVKPIEPIVPVHIEVGSSKVDTPASTPAAASPGKREYTEMASAIAKELSISVEQIHITDGQDESQANADKQRR